MPEDEKKKYPIDKTDIKELINFIGKQATIAVIENYLSKIKNPKLFQKLQGGPLAGFRTNAIKEDQIEEVVLALVSNPKTDYEVLVRLTLKAVKKLGILDIKNEEDLENKNFDPEKADALKKANIASKTKISLTHFLQIELDPALLAEEKPNPEIQAAKEKQKEEDQEAFQKEITEKENQYHAQIEKLTNELESIKQEKDKANSRRNLAEGKYTSLLRRLDILSKENIPISGEDLIPHDKLQAEIDKKIQLLSSLMENGEKEKAKNLLISLYILISLEKSN
jgi:NADH dehydrogenase/NADH:ubiquinone oxidoreductase subunit G